MKRQSFSCIKTSPSRSTEYGAFVVLIALAVMVLLALVGLAVDAASIQRTKLRLQRAVDSSSIVGTYWVEDRSIPDLREIAENTIRDNIASHGLVANNIQVELLPPSSNPPRAVRVTANVNPPLYIMNLLPWIGGSKTVSASARAGNRKRAVVLILDRSGSMNRNVPCSTGTCHKMCEAKKAANRFVDLLDENEDRFALVSFSDNETVNYTMRRNPDKAALHAIIGDCDDGPAGDLGDGNGWTNTSAALQAARAEMARSVNDDLLPTDLRAIVIVTDGAPTRGLVDIPADCDVLYPIPPPPPPAVITDLPNYYHRLYASALAQANAARSEGSTIYAVGLGAQGVPDTTQPIVTCPRPLPPNADWNLFPADDPFQCAHKDNDYIVKDYLLSYLANDWELALGNPNIMPPVPPHPDFPEECVPKRVSISGARRGRLYQTNDPSALTAMLEAIGRSLKVKLTK